MNNKKMMLLGFGLILLFSNLFSIEQELRERYEEKLAQKQEVYNKTLQFIQDNPDSPGLAKMYYNLAEMSVEVDVNDPQKTAEYFGKVIELDPDFAKIDAVLYNFAYYYTESQINQRDLGRQENIDAAINWPDQLRINEEKMTPAIEAYERILEEFPYSKFYSETLYRLGNLYFEIAIDARIPLQYYDQALVYYEQLAQKENDSLQNHAIFQKGWTYFASGRYEQAIDTFSKVLEFIESDSSGIYKTYFEADAIENIAFGLIEYDGTDFEQYSQAAEKVIEIFQNFNEENVKEIIFAAVDLKKTYNAPMQAIDLYNSYLQLYPNDINAPIIIDSIMTVYQRNPARTRQEQAEDLIIQQMERLVNNYSYGSQWYEQNQESLEKDSPQFTVIQKAFEFIEPRYYNNFVRSQRYDDFLVYENLIEKYVNMRELADSINVAKKTELRLNLVRMSQEIAEMQQDPSDYLMANRYITQFDSLHQDHPERADLNDLKYRNYEQVYTILQDTVKVAAYEIEELGITLDAAGLDSLYTQASQNYQEFLTQPDNYDDIDKDILARVVYNRAELNYELEKYDLAYEDFSDLLTIVEQDSLNQNEDLNKIAYARLAEISQERGNYAEAENFYRRASQFAEDTERDSFQNNILASMQAKANTLADSLDYITAANEYLRISEELAGEDDEKSAGFKAKAIENFEAAGEYQTAIDLLLDIAAQKEEKNDKLAAFIKAWTITDSLADYQQSEMLRQRFIAQYPTSNEAYRLQVQIIDFYENEPYQDTLRAAEMYLDLHEEAASGNLDIGEVNPASIYLKAIDLYRNFDREDRLVALMLDFEERYPEHEMANRFLTNVARIYNERNETGKFEQLARKLYRKDPAIDILRDVAVNKLRDLKTEIDDLFEAQNYDDMTNKIEEFDQMVASYEADGLVLPLESIYESFDYYNAYINYYERYEQKLAAIRDEFINADPNDLVRVNENTKWLDHLGEGQSRISKLMTQCKDYRQELINLIRAGNEYELPTEKRTEALYLAGYVYEHGFEVIQQQLTKFIDVSLQLNRREVAENPVLQKQWKDETAGRRDKIVNNLKREAAITYISMLKNFADNSEYSDQYTEMATTSLIDWGHRNPKIFVDYFTDSQWQMGTVSSLDSLENATWEQVEVVQGEQLLESAEIINLPADNYRLLKTNFELEYMPELYTIDYLSDFPTEIILNGEKLELENSSGDLLEYAGRNLQEYRVAFNKNLVLGENELIFVFPANITTETNFAAHIKLQYDEAKLEFAQTTEKKELVSDNDWKVTLNKELAPEEIFTAVNADTIEVDLAWQNAATGNMEFFKNQIFGMESSAALDIWHPEIDTTEAQTVLFYKEFELEEEVLSAEATFLGQEECTVWLNGEQLGESFGTVFDSRAMKAQAHKLELDNLVVGKNIILIEVTGDTVYKGLIFELDYIVRKR